MTLKTLFRNWLYAALAATVLAGCASDNMHRAPVLEHGATAKKTRGSSVNTATKKTAPREKDWRPQTYVVQKGDTLYSIAFNHGLDYHELAELNGIQNPGVIKLGQEIRLLPESHEAAPKPAPEIKPAAMEPPIKNYPKVAKLPYSEQAVAEIGKMQETPSRQEPVALAKIERKPDPRPDAETNSPGEDTDDELDWVMPTAGKIIGEFSGSTNRKGIDVTGKLGQAIMASAAGKVVYSGNGLRGYGKLVIIKHNKTYLSAYAHNSQILVKEGQSVARGQKIAEMGNTDAEQVKLHFEIRKFGKPVDPGKYLPLVKS